MTNAKIYAIIYVENEREVNPVSVKELNCYDVVYYNKDNELLVESTWASDVASATKIVQNRHPLETLSVYDVHIRGDYHA